MLHKCVALKSDALTEFGVCSKDLSVIIVTLHFTVFHSLFCCPEDFCLCCMNCMRTRSWPLQPDWDLYSENGYRMVDKMLLYRWRVYISVYFWGVLSNWQRSNLKTFCCSFYRNATALLILKSDIGICCHFNWNDWKKLMILTCVSFQACHSETHIGQYYTLPSAHIRTLFPSGLPWRYQQQVSSSLDVRSA